MSSAGGCPSWQAMVSVRTSIVPPRPCPPLPDTPGTSSAVTTPQVTASIHDFAVSLLATLICALRECLIGGVDVALPPKGRISGVGIRRHLSVGSVNPHS
jgi:hypothetical protein